MSSYRPHIYEDTLPVLNSGLRRAESLFGDDSFSRWGLQKELKATQHRVAQDGLHCGCLQ